MANNPKRSSLSKTKAPTSFNTYKITTGLLIFLASMHTYGAFTENDFGVQGNAVYAAMKSVRFDMFGSDRTYSDLYFGSGIVISVYILFTAYLSWHLSRQKEDLAVLRPVKWGLFLTYAMGALISFRYFFMGPTISTLLVVVLTGWECVK